ncbi:MAG: acyl-CoA synthetase [Candidatus Bathycorpusculaceae bacterium]
MGSAREFLEARDFLLTVEDYEEAKRDFKWPRMGEFNWALDYFDRMAEERTDSAMIIVDDEGVEERVSFRRLKERSNQVANYLKSNGLGKGDRILLLLPNRVELFEVFLGAMKVGCPIIPASTLLTSADIEDRITRGRIKCVISDGQLAERVEQAGGAEKLLKSKIIVEGQLKGWRSYSETAAFSSTFTPDERFFPEDELLIYFTSGTTAKPKLVLHTHSSYPVGHLTTMYWIGLRPGDLHYNISAPGWAKHAWSTIFAAWNAEATTFIYAYAGRFDPKKTLEKIEEYEIKTLCAPPTVLRLFLLENLKKYSFALREVVSAGEPLNPEIVERVKEDAGITIREGYGQTETTLQIGTFPGVEVKAGSMGVEAPGFSIAVIDYDSHKAAPEGREGAIAIRVKPERPVGLMTRYIDPEEKNLEVFVEDWYLTGDLAIKDRSGYFWFIGRVDDVFKSSDYRIGPFELESELLMHELVAESAVVASPDELRGFVPKAFITLKPGFSPSRENALELFKFIRARIAPYKRPRIIEFTPELPKTVSGKIKRTDLRVYEMELRSKKARASNEYFEGDFAQELKK